MASTELNEILDVDSKEQLSRIDNALKTFLSFCAQYHGMLSSNSSASDPDPNAGPRRIVFADQPAAGARMFNASRF
jgi:hypothetical protein